MSEINRLIGERIRLYRKKAGLTQEALAEKAGLHGSYISQLSVPAVCLRLPALASPAGESPISPSALTGDKPFRKPGTAFQGNRLYKTSNNAGNAFHLLAISV